VVLFVIRVVLLLIVLFYVLFLCKCVLYPRHRVSTQLQLTNISYHTICYHISSYITSHHITSHNISYIISYHISYHIISYHISYHIISYHIISYHITSHKNAARILQSVELLPMKSSSTAGECKIFSSTKSLDRASCPLGHCHWD
jgi:hypothetical protein